MNSGFKRHSPTRGRTFSEPTTMVTDFLLALVAAAMAVLVLDAPAAPVGAARAAWSATFALTAAAAVLGGVFHGFRHRMSGARAERIWTGTLLLSAGGSGLLLVSAGLAAGPGWLRWGIGLLAAGKLLIAGLYAVRAGRFGVVMWDAGISVLIVLGIGLWRWGIDGEAAAAWTAAGAVAALAGGAVQRSPRRFPLHLDHNDFFHLAQALACYLLYRGAAGG